MELVTPGLGLLIWMSLAFGILFFLLKAFAWKPILAMIAEREQGIEEALVAAEKAKKELRELNVTNERLLAEARVERDTMLKEAREAREEVIKTAKDAAKIEADKIMISAREAINNEKNAALAEVKNQVATLSVEIAEKILRGELSTESKQKALNAQLLNDIKLN
jgi:F-type H+-transporting ATPase subunit b